MPVSTIDKPNLAAHDQTVPIEPLPPVTAGEVIGSQPTTNEPEHALPALPEDVTPTLPSSADTYGRHDASSVDEPYPVAAPEKVLPKHATGVRGFLGRIATKLGIDTTTPIEVGSSKNDTTAEGIKMIGGTQEHIDPTPNDAFRAAQGKADQNK